MFNQFQTRRTVLVGTLAFGFTAFSAGPGQAGILDGNSLKSLLANASDGALNKLGTPGAFYADLAIRILLPGTSGKLASKLMAAGDRLGLTSKLTKSLNDAAGLAAFEADGATQYLRSSVGEDLQAKVRPLILSALTRVGAFDQLGKLGKTGGGLLGLVNINNDTLTDSVTKQALGGIFNYMGKEESGLRGNVLGIGKGLLDTIIK
jgi:Protein of unknown function (DUF4197)